MDRALNVEGECGTGSDPRIVEEGRADLIHHLLQHREFALAPEGKNALNEVANLLKKKTAADPFFIRISVL